MATSKKKKLTTKDLKKVSGGAAKPGATGGPAKISQGRTAAGRPAGGTMDSRKG